LKLFLCVISEDRHCGIATNPPGRKAKRRVPATRYYTQRCASTVAVPGLGVPGQKLADCSMLSAKLGAEISL